jgi:hypothetical protein
MRSADAAASAAPGSAGAKTATTTATRSDRKPLRTPPPALRQDSPRGPTGRAATAGSGHDGERKIVIEVPPQGMSAEEIARIKRLEATDTHAGAAGDDVDAR